MKNTSYGGTRFATFRTIKASPGSKPRIFEGQTRESAQAITINCRKRYRFRGNYSTIHWI